MSSNRKTSPCEGGNEGASPSDPTKGAIMIVCVCNAVNTKELFNRIKEASELTEDELLEHLHVANRCGVCEDEVRKIIRSIVNTRSNDWL